MWSAGGYLTAKALEKVKDLLIGTIEALQILI